MKTTTIDGISMPLETPGSMAELAACVQRCAKDGTAVFPVGGGTGLNYGLPPSRPGVAISLQQLNRVVDYPVEDLTITVEAGMTVASLQALLAQNNQRLPIDVPNAETATVGGAIAINAAGPRRLGYGTWRDWIIGMTVVNDRGELCKSGGRVVKNVAGYDLGKLYTGSLGALGVIVQVTLKLQPRPDVARWITIPQLPAGEFATTLDKIAASTTQPRAVELVGHDDRFELHVLFEDNAESVAWQTDQLKQELRALQCDAAASDLEPRLRDRTVLRDLSMQLIATMRSSQVGALLASPAIRGWKVQAQAMNGTVWLGCDFPDQAAAANLLANVRNQVSGNVVIRRCPTAWKSSLPVWGKPPAAIELMKNVHAELDPKNILNPGRTLT